LIDIYKKRVERLLNLINEKDLDSLFLFPGPNIGYLTGFHISPSERLSAAIIPINQDPVLVVPGLERELRGQKSWIEDIRTWEESENPIDLIVEIFQANDLDEARIGLEEYVWWGVINKIQKKLPKVKFMDVSGEIQELRMVKSKLEVEYIQKACGITDLAIKAGFESLQKGMTELELSSVISDEMTRQGGSPHLGIVLFGDRSALPHANPSGRKLKKGDIILVDTSTTWNCYWSDSTRTILFGEPTEQQKRIWNTVLKANKAAKAAVAPNIKCEDVDKAARDIIDVAGFGDYFIHRVGHGIGLQVHEHPYMVKGNEQLLKPYMTFTIEPGIYITGLVGVRIEDTVVCTESGCESLTNLERRLTLRTPD